MTTPLPTTKPWKNGFRSFDKNRILVIANTDVSWSYSTCEYYCRARGIPIENILSYSLGSLPSPSGGVVSSDPAAYWYPTSMGQAYARVLTPLAEICRRKKVQAILLGPGIPASIYAIEFTGSPNPTTPDFAPLHTLFATCIGSLEPGALRSGIMSLNASTGAWVQTDSSASFFGYVGIPSYDYWPLSFDGSFSASPNYLDYHTITNFTNSLTIAKEYATKIVGEDPHYYGPDLDGYKKFYGLPTLPIGRIGFTSAGGGYLGGPPVNESEALVKDIIDRTTYQMAVYDWKVALQKPILYNLSNQDGGIKSSIAWSYLRYLAESWGLNTKYGYYDPKVNVYGDALTYSSYEGAAYTNVELQAGTVSEEYYLMVGEWTNPAIGGYYTAPYDDCWLPLPGAGVAQGPSDGFESSLWGLYQGGSAAMGDGTHITVSEEVAYMNTYLALLRGMTWLEACFYGNTARSLPCGDPLWAPFRTTGYDLPQRSGARPRRL